MNSLSNQLLRGVARFWPQPLLANRRERLISCLGAALGLIITEFVCRYAFGLQIPWLLAPMGASAVLLFAIPASPLAQPWSIVGGNLVASLVGVSCTQLIPDSSVAAGIAVAVSIALMFPLRCVHPPSGAVAITAVLGGPVITQLGFGFVFYPVLINSLLLTAFALLFNNAFKRRYPHAVHLPPAKTAEKAAASTEPMMITQQHIHAALANRGEMVDIDEEDLLEIFTAAQHIATRNTLSRNEIKVKRAS